MSQANHSEKSGTEHDLGQRQGLKNGNTLTENWAPDALNASAKHSIRRKPVPTSRPEISVAAARGNAEAETSCEDNNNRLAEHSGGNRLGISRNETSESVTSVPLSETSSSLGGFGATLETESNEKPGPSDGVSSLKPENVKNPKTQNQNEDPRSINKGFSPNYFINKLSVSVHRASNHYDGTNRGHPMLIIGGFFLILSFYIALFPWKESRSGVTPSSPVIAIMGETGAGKSSFIKALRGRDDKGNEPTVGHSLNSTTKAVTWYSVVSGPRGFWIIDTPGFDDSYLSDYEILDGLTNTLAKMYRSGRPLAGIIYVHDISKEKMGGTSHKSLRTFQKLVGDTSLESVKLVTTHWKWFFRGAQLTREGELRDGFWESMIGRGSEILRHDGSKASALRITNRIVSREPVVVKIVDEMVNKGLPLARTDAGGAVAESISDLESRLNSDIAALNEELTDLKQQKKESEENSAARLKGLKEQWDAASAADRQRVKEQMDQINKDSEDKINRLNKLISKSNMDRELLGKDITKLQVLVRRFETEIALKSKSASGVPDILEKTSKPADSNIPGLVHTTVVVFVWFISTAFIGVGIGGEVSILFTLFTMMAMWLGDFSLDRVLVGLGALLFFILCFLWFYRPAEVG